MPLPYNFLSKYAKKYRKHRLPVFFQTQSITINYLLREDLLQAGEAGQAVLIAQSRLALEQRRAVIDEGVGNIGVVAGDPLERDLFLGVGNTAQVDSS